MEHKQSSNNERQSLVDTVGYYGVIEADALTTSMLAIVLLTAFVQSRTVST